MLRKTNPKEMRVKRESHCTLVDNKCSLQFSRSVMSDSLPPHGLQHDRLPVHHQIPSLLKFMSIVKEISPEYSLEGLMLKLKFQYLGHLIRRTGSFKKTLTLGKIESRRRRG